MYCYQNVFLSKCLAIIMSCYPNVFLSKCIFIRMYFYSNVLLSKCLAIIHIVLLSKCLFKENYQVCVVRLQVNAQNGILFFRLKQNLRNKEYDLIDPGFMTEPGKDKNVDSVRSLKYDIV